ncbi:hypothetical protein [Pyrobaculum neutrophilum]|uniref:Type II secretion system protein n=1 Tax=Pyrobaculum neutrophilum (strain DSM 2338 / JCM 9278 / NBRC 100436 / V24Sta) TaxID=444157 RepID=B1Y8R7_PYRNV|nr:hypothetical protein [Pyrobaculum neutrophilum]ACB40146.1 conserved hypothetical protein [Pyrobaculum neutrophilum V24Sta]
MRREDFYIAAAPIFATYLGAVSGAEALKYTSFNAAELDEVEARRLFVSSLMPSPSAAFLEEKEEAARQMGYALAQEEAGVDRSVLVYSYLEGMRALAVAKVEARARLYESITSSLGAVFLLPLFLLFLWAVGVLSVEPLLLLALIYGVTAALGAVAVAAAPHDLDLWRTYEWSLVLGAGAAALAAFISPPAAFIAFGVTTWLWLRARDRAWWFSIRREVPPMLRSVAAMLKEGAPPDVILGRLVGSYKTAAKIAYGYFVPSRYFVLAKAMYKAIVEAGGAAASKAVEYIQALIDIESASVKRVAKLSTAYFSLFIAAVFVLAMATSSAVKQLSAVETGYNPFFSPPPYDEIRQVLSTAMSLVAAGYVAVVLSPLGLHRSTALGGAAGLALQHALQILI